MSRRVERAGLAALRGCALGSAAIVLLMVGFLGLESLPALSRIGAARLLTDRGWHPGAAQPMFGLGAMAAATLLCAAGAVALAGPMGVTAAVFCRFYAPRAVAGAYRRVLQLLAGIPSVVYGFWGLTTLAPLLRRLEPPGTNLLCGVLVLALMILPTVALLADAALAAVPRDHLRAAAALAMSRGATVLHVALPTARAGLGAAVLLGGARAVGETMAVLMVSGNVVQMPHSLFDPVRTLTANMALELGYAAGDHRAALFASGLLLMVIVGLLVIGAARVMRSTDHG